MRHIVITLLSLFFVAFLAQARNIDQETAERYAKLLLSGPLVKQAAQTKAPVSSAQDPYYIFNSSTGGFVIIAGDDSVEPVLGYCDKGSFETDNMPDNLRWWLGMWADQIKANVSRGDVADDEIRAQWEALENGGSLVKAGSSKLLTTANWGQGFPYNAFCPSFGSGQSITGCAATATAIIMRYFGYPEKGSGKLPGYSYSISGETRSISGYALGDKYDWSNMPLEYSGAESSVQQNAVARLMHDVGVMISMQYDAEGSAACANDIAPGLKKYMGYDKSSTIYYYEFFSHNDWISMMKKFIDDKVPFCYGGQSESGGHEFVVDGYDASSRFHINWGWNGQDNGYFTIGSFKDFNTGQDIVVCKPDEGGEDSHYLTLISEGGSKGLTCDTDTFTPGVTFKCHCEWLANFVGEDFSGKCALARISKTGEIKEVSTSVSISLPYGSMMKYTFQNISFSAIEIGDYMTMVTKLDGSSNWIRSSYDHTNKNIVATIPLADAKSIEEASTIKYTVSTGILLVSTKEDATWTFKKESGADASGAATWDATKGHLTIDSNKLDAGNYVLVISKGIDSKTLKFTF